MSIDFGFIGWCNNPAGNHDKIWGYIYRPSEVDSSRIIWNYLDKNWGRNVVIFWARRGQAIQIKPSISGHGLNALTSSKLSKGYREISKEKFLEIWPSFTKEFEEKLMWNVLSGKVK